VKSGGERVRAENKGNRTVQKIHISLLEAESQVIGDYRKLYDQWVADLQSGALIGRPVTPQGLQTLKYGLEKLWQYSGQNPTLDRITAETLKIALGGIQIDHQRRNCHFSVRDQMYKSLVSFSKFLIREGVLPVSILDQIRLYKPKRHYQPKKIVLTAAEVERILEKNWSIRTGGRSDIDQFLSAAIVMMGAFAGLRRAEIIDLGLADVNMAEGYMQVAGKGGKCRPVGLLPGLAEFLVDWLAIRPSSDSGRLFVQENGIPLTASVIRGRLDRLSAATGIEFSPHALRRSFATIMEGRGMPWSYVQKALGHADIKTTQGYVMADERASVEWLKSHGRDTVPEITDIDRLKALASMLSR